MPEVRPERTAWRDEAISQRHREWGWDCPAIDIDFLLLEYDRGRAVALVEYKNQHAAPQKSTHPSYQALIDLGNRAGIPVFAVRYTDDFKQWHVTPLNDHAAGQVPLPATLSESQWVDVLYYMRGRKLPEAKT